MSEIGTPLADESSDVPSIGDLRANCNPGLGGFVYSTAALPCENVDPPCTLQQPVIYDDDETPEVIFPSCVAVISPTNGAEVEQQYTFNPDNNTYEAPNGASATYDVSSGWEFTTPIGTYQPPEATQNPSNVYCTQDGDVITVVECSKANIDTDELSDCVNMVYAEDTTITLDVFENNGGTFQPSGAGAGQVSYNGTNWLYQINGVTYTGPTTPNNATGIYTDDDGRCVLFKDDCQGPCTVPETVRTTLADDVAILLGDFTAVDNLYTAADPLQGTLSYDGSVWSYIVDGVTYTGPADKCDPSGLYEAPSGDNVVIKV